MRKSGIIASIFCFLYFLSSFNVVLAASFSFGEIATKNIQKGATFSVPVSINTDDKSITGADAVILYDPETLMFVKAEDQHFFPFFTAKDSQGTLRLSGVVTDVENLKQGKGHMATVQFKAKKAGTASLQIVCDTSTNATSKIVFSDLDATNIITCTEIHDKKIQIAGGSILSTVTEFLFGWWK